MVYSLHAQNADPIEQKLHKMINLPRYSALGNVLDYFHIQFCDLAAHEVPDTVTMNKKQGLKNSKLFGSCHFVLSVDIIYYLNNMFDFL